MAPLSRTTLLLVLALLASAMTTRAADFAYFLDRMSDADVAHTPAGYAVIGEVSRSQREEYAAEGRIVGQTTALQNQSASTGFNLWPYLSNLFSGSVPPSPMAILNAALLYGYPSIDFPSPEEGRHTPAGGYVVWTQDFEYNPYASDVSAAQVYAGVTAVLWACRQVLGDNVKIIPVPSSSLFKGLNYNSAAMLSLISSLNLRTPPGRPSGGREWNFLSLLYYNHLIDGFLGQQYSTNNPTALPGSVSSDTLPFYDSHMPYAILSSLYSPAQLKRTRVGNSPWQSHYYGDMPFHAGVYWASHPVDTGGNATVSNDLFPARRQVTAMSRRGHHIF